MSSPQNSTSTPPKRPRVGLHAESMMFLAIAAFFIVSGVIYWVFSKDPAGIAALLLSAGLCIIIGSYLSFVSRRLEGPRPEDDPMAEVSDGAGELGFFSPGSYTPFGVALGAAFLGFAIAYWLVWLVFIAIGFLMLAVCSLVFEYHRGPATH